MAFIDLTTWKLTLPVDKSGAFGGSATEVTSLQGYLHPLYFYTASDGALVFNAPADGATTSGSSYARSELREMSGGDKAAWTLQQGGVLTATLEVDQVPLKSDGSAGRVIVGQIHGQDDELVRLYWEKGTVYFMNDQAGAKNTETRFDFTAANGQAPDISLNEKFSYKIDAHGDNLLVNIYADGQTYTSSTRISDVWDTDSFYFKAGVYLGVNEGSGTGSGQTSFYHLAVDHGGKPVPDPTLPPASGPVVTKPADPVVPKPATEDVTITGTSGSDVLQAGAGNDTVKGGGGHDTIAGGLGGDVLWGNDGDDTLVGGAGQDWMKGGAGRDTYVFARGHGNDTVHELRSGDGLVFDGGVFASADAARAAMKQTSAGVTLQTGQDSSILFTGSSLAQVKSAAISFTDTARTATAPAQPAASADEIVHFEDGLKKDGGTGFDVLEVTGDGATAVKLAGSALKGFEAVVSSGAGQEQVSVSLKELMAESGTGGKAAFAAIIGNQAGDAIALSGSGWTFAGEVDHGTAAPRAQSLGPAELASLAKAQNTTTVDASDMNGFVFQKGAQSVTVWSDLDAGAVHLNGIALDHVS
jgi:hypothetical protein